MIFHFFLILMLYLFHIFPAVKKVYVVKNVIYKNALLSSSIILSGFADPHSEEIMNEF